MAAIGKACWPLAFLVAIVVSGQAANAVPIQVTVDTSGLSGTLVSLAFDLIDGGPPSNSVTIYDFTSDGALGPASITHDFATVPASDLTAPVTFDDSGVFFNEYLQGITLGNSLSFRFDTTGNPPDPGSLADAFSLSILNDTAAASLISTSDPSSALFLYGIGASNPLQLFDVLTPDGVTVQASEVPTGAPEPGALALAMTGLLALGMVAAVKQ